MSMPVTRLNSSTPKLSQKTLIQYYVWIKLVIITMFFSLSDVEFIDKQRNCNDIMIFSIKLFAKNDNDINLFKKLTTIVPHDWNCNVFAIYL